MDPREKVLFSEVQRFRQTWIWIILTIAVAASWYFFIEAVFLGAVDDAAGIAISVGVWIFAGILLPYLFWELRLESEVRSGGIIVRFVPFHFKPKYFPWAEIKGFEAVEYRPIMDYGGWGIRYGRRGKAFNVSGKEGIMLSFKDGRRDLLIGSKHPHEFADAIKNAKWRR